MNVRTLWRGRPPMKRKKMYAARRVGAGDVRAPATLGSFARPDRKQDDGNKRGPTGTL
jgi:hypothetical protein